MYFPPTFRGNFVKYYSARDSHIATRVHAVFEYALAGRFTQRPVVENHEKRPQWLAIQPSWPVGRAALVQGVSLAAV